MLLKSKLFKKLFNKVIHYVEGHENRIKKVEYLRALYRYPHKMIGRIFPSNYINYTDVLVFAAHPDDDVLGLGTTLYRHSLNNKNIKVVFVTNGSGWDGESWKLRTINSKEKSELRYWEAVKALSLVNIPKENIFCLGFPDGGTQRYLNNMSVDILMLIQKLNPERIYVHCIEGGHRDHDMTSFVVKSVCNKIGFSNVFEWAEYNPLQYIGTQDIRFLPAESNTLNEIKIDISEEELILKRRMLGCHYSQDVEQYYLQGEAIRKAIITKLEKELYNHGELPKKRIMHLVKNFNEFLLS